MINYLQRSPFIRILLPFVAGILLQSLLPFLKGTELLIPIGVLTTLLLLLRRRSAHRPEILSGFLFTLFFLAAGFYLQTEKNKPVVFIKAIGYQATLLESPVEKNKSYAAEVLLTVLFTEDSTLAACEKLMVYFAKDTAVLRLKPGNRIFFTRSPVEIKNMGNPGEFDYKKYAGRKGFFRQVYLDRKSWVQVNDDPEFRIVVLAEKTRDYLLAIYKDNGLAGTEFEILSALTLGYKKSMDPEIKQVFAATGASHVLAVSGLHVGIVYLVFNLFFGYLRRNRFTRFIFVISAVIFLWSFAFITGLSPSVQRSALMFTIVLVGENLRRPANTFNTLAASAFILLAINPNLFYDAGFQLSYAAVAGIVYFQPRLNACLRVRSKIAGYIWGLFTVSLAAQVTTFPLSCYYFNQFPVYFWLSNFIVIPLAFVFIFLGILILATSPIPLVSATLAKVAIFLVKLLYSLLEGIGNLPFALIRNFSFPLIIMILTFLILLSLIIFIESRQPRFFLLMTILTITGITVSSVKKIIQNHTKQIIVYHTDYPLLHLIYGRSNYIILSDSFLKNEFPERETGNVIRKMRLKKPVIVREEDDFTDACLVKRGSCLFFDGMIIKWEDEDNLHEVICVPDIIITTGGKNVDEGYPENCRIISYEKQRSGKPEMQDIYRVKPNGAWVLRQNLLVKNLND